MTCTFFQLSAQVLNTPLAENNYSRVTSYEQLMAFIYQLDEKSELLQLQTIGQSVQGRNIVAMKFSTSEVGKDESKIKVLIFAQQHGNEQSGKEGALMLALQLLNPENRYLFNKMDVVLIPQINPDGSEVNKRRNANNMDLNRNHLILSEPETQALHRFFEKYMFEVNMDVHEYSPLGDEWIKYGYRKNTAVALGGPTNINISSGIRDLANQKALPYMMQYLNSSNFSSFVYCPGGPPELDYIRHSTFDINDGRQSFGILNSLCFIQEGMNGDDMYIDNIKFRAESQCKGMRGLLEFVFLNKEEIKIAVHKAREQSIVPEKGAKIAIQTDHFGNGEKLELPLFSYKTGNDTMVVVNDYRPLVKSINEVEKPEGYLIPKSNTELIGWLERQRIHSEEFVERKGLKILKYTICSIDSIDFERDIIVNPIVKQQKVRKLNSIEDYVYVPCNQLKGTMLVLALEPKSMLGLVTYSQYAHLLKVSEPFPVLRVEKN